jgi:outer membrane immunogenic protein
LTRAPADTTVPPLRRNASGVGLSAGRGMGAVRSWTIAAALASAMLPAAAAELPIEAYPVRPVLVVFRWTGIYAGVHAGGASGYLMETPVPFLVTGSTVAPLPASLTTTGWLAGGQIGANYQVESWVLGIEAQASWANLTGSTSCVANSVPPTFVVAPGNCTAKIDALGTAAARLGVAFDRLLLYGKGGAAWTNDNYQVLIPIAVRQLVFSTNLTRWGWMVGLGIEYAFTDNWTAKIEYNYMDLGTYAVRFQDAFTYIPLDSNTRERVNVVKVGVNYRIGVSPILIK